MGRLSRPRAFWLPLILTALIGACSSDESQNENDAAIESAEATESTEPSVPADPESFPEIVANVNGTEIHRDELIERVTMIRSRGAANVDTSTLDFYREVLDQLVASELLYQSSQDQNIGAEESEIDAQIETVKGRFPDPSMFEAALAEEGITLEQFRDRMARDMSIQKLVDRDFAADITVTDDDKREFYHENAEEMRQPDRLRLSHILKRVAPEASLEDREKAQATLEDLRQQAESGGDFAALAREHSEDPGSAANGGEMVVARGQTVPPFEEAAFALETGEVSDVVETRFGFHIIKLSEKIPGDLVPYEQVQARIEEYLTQQAVQERVESAVETLRAQGEVETFI